MAAMLFDTQGDLDFACQFPLECLLIWSCSNNIGQKIDLKRLKDLFLTTRDRNHEAKNGSVAPID